jgi:FeS assembly protein SufD
MRRLSHEEGKFSAATAAFWSGGAFLHVPRGVKVERPIQVVYLIDEPGTAQYAHTLAVAGEQAECAIREYCLAPDIEGQALHAGAFELYLEAGANVKLAHYQDWGRGEVYDLSTKRVEIGRDAHCSWVPIHLGGRLTKQTLDIVTAERGSDMRHTGLYFTERDEHLDLFTTDLHEQGDTTGDTVWKGALTGESRASYEGLIQIDYGAQNSHTYLQTHSMLLSPKAKGDAIPSLIVKTDNVSASHGGTVGEIDEEQVFYMMTRGISRQDAVRTLVEGYFEEVVQRLHDESLEQIVRERISAKLTAAEEQVVAFTAER